MILQKGRYRPTNILLHYIANSRSINKVSPIFFLISIKSKLDAIKYNRNIRTVLLKLANIANKRNDKPGSKTFRFDFLATAVMPVNNSATARI